MKKIYHLSSCSTCQRIIKELEQVLKSPLDAQGFDLQDIKVKNISAKELDDIKEKAGSYEALFSKRAIKYRSMGLDKMTLTERDYRKYMLEVCTFLKRPFILVGEEVFIGNSKKTIEAAIFKLQ
jgi:arsenate reductase (glutaredoxin)